MRAVLLLFLMSTSLYGQCDLDDVIYYESEKKVLVSEKVNGVSSSLLSAGNGLEFSSDFKIGKVEEIVNGVGVWVRFKVFSEQKVRLNGLSLTLDNNTSINILEDRMFLEGEIKKEEENLKLLGETIKSTTFSCDYFFLLEYEQISSLSKNKIKEVSFNYYDPNEKKMDATMNRKISGNSAKKINKIIDCIVTELNL